jgi:peptide/nickel transport system ATP-binding protein
MSSEVLTINHLHTYLQSREGLVHAVDDVCLTIKKGQTLALVGESGSGKTVTAHSIAQLLPENTIYGRNSQIKLGDVDLLNLSELELRKIRGKRIGMVFQEPMTSLNPVMTIYDQISEVLRAHTTLNKKERTERVMDLLHEVGILDIQRVMYNYPHQFSGGMKQRVMIAMALALSPDLLIADEPTTALDVTVQTQILALFKKIQQQFSMGILLITHDLGVVAEVADTVAVMYAGQIIEYATSQVYFSRAQHPYSQRLFESLPNINKRNYALDVIPGHPPSLIDIPQGCRFAPRCRYAWDLCEQVTPALTATLTQQVRCHLYTQENPLTALPKFEQVLLPHEQSKHHSETILTAQDLKVYFPIQKGLFRRTVDYVKAVDGVDLTLQSGQTLAIVGESGSGKTTLGKALLKLIPASFGKIVYLGPPDLQAHTQIIFQDPYSSLDPRMRIGEIIAEGLHAPSRERVKFLLEQVGLSKAVIDHYPHQFSGGQRQRIAIARALAISPKIIICDEPTSALDVSVQAQIVNLLKNLQQELGIAYIFISHNLAVVSYLADTIAVMYEGKIVEYADAETLFAAPQHPYTQALLSAIPAFPAQQ